MKVKHLTLLVSLMLSYCSICHGEIKSYIEKYPLLSSDRSRIITATKELLEGEGKVFYFRDTNELVVSTTKDNHQMITALLSKINHPEPNIRMDLEIRRAGTSSSSGAGVTGSGNIILNKDGRSSKFTFQPHIRNQSAANSSNVRQTLTVQSGRECVLSIGQDIPYMDWIMEMGRNWGYFSSSVSMQRVGASLRALPRVIGNGPMISIRIVPEISGTIENPNGKSKLRRNTIKRVEFVNMATEVMATDGRRLVLGSFNEHSDFYDKFLTGKDSGGKATSIEIVLTPHILKTKSRHLQQ